MVTWNNRSTSRLVGQRVERREAPLKVTGAATYTADVQLEGMLYAVVVRSPHARATVRALDVSKAEAAPGVRAVHAVAEAGAALRYQGQEIVGVAAETELQALDAARLVEIDYEVLPHKVRTEEAAGGPPKVPAELPGDIEEALQGATRVTATYQLPVRLHSCLESHGAVVRWDGDDRCTIWTSTQAVHGTRAAMAANLGLPQDNVRVICEHMGGGFGSKLSPTPDVGIAAQLARKAAAPVKLMLDRTAEQLATGNGPDAHVALTCGVRPDGKLAGLWAVAYGTSGNSSRWSMPFPFVYDFGETDVSQHGISTNCGPQAPLRAPMRPQTCAITEWAIDRAAVAAGLDPLQVRLANQTNDVRRRQFERGAELIGWERRSRGLGSGRYRRGIGVASGEWGGGGRAGARVDVEIHPDGRVLAKVGSQDLGTGTRTWLAAVVAEDLGLPVERVDAQVGDSDFGYAGASGGSTTAPSVSPVAKTAVLEARRQLFDKVAPLLGAEPDQLEAKDGRISVVDSGDGGGGRSLGFAEACAKLGPGGISVAGTFAGELQQSGTAGVQFVEVEVDTWLGRVRPVKVVVVQDCGYCLNRTTAESQVIGAVVQGLGMALLEGREMDEQTGRALNADLENYKPPGALEIPEIVPVLFDTHEKVTGIGEPPVIPTAGAVGNAIFDAIGVQLKTLPFTPQRVLEGLS